MFETRLFTLDLTHFTLDLTLLKNCLSDHFLIITVRLLCTTV